MKAVSDKVLCYIVRSGQLLVFRHVDLSWEEVGVQVPAGTIQAGEDPASAALREATEETGLSGLRLVRKLGQYDYDVTPYRREIQRRHVYHLAVDGAVPRRWCSEEADSDRSSNPIRLECFWVPLDSAHVLQSGQGALIGRLFERECPD